jgi:hypothetical protein
MTISTSPIHLFLVKLSFWCVVKGKEVSGLKHDKNMYLVTKIKAEIEEDSFE